MAAVLPPPLPVAIEQVKAYLRVAGSDEDALLAGLVRTASELCEAFTRSALVEREVEETIPARPAWTRLEAAPVRAILAVAAVGADGGETALAADAFAIDIDTGGDGWVRVLQSGATRSVSVRYRAGRATDWNGVPEPLRQGVIRMAAHLYTHRDPEGGGGPPAAVTALWLPYRRLRIG